MNKTLHLIKKDLRVSAWWLLVWTILCLTHFGLRMHQLSFGDTIITSGFWSNLETTERWDWQIIRWLPLLVIPFFLHTDPLVKRYAFWKSLPINRWRLVVTKLVSVIIFFLLLPLVLEFIYLRSAGLASIMGGSLLMWSLRFLPMVVAVTLACFLTPNMLWGLPTAALIYFISLKNFSLIRPSYLPKERINVTTLQTPPTGVRIVVDSDSGVVQPSSQITTDPTTGKQIRTEISQLSVKVRVDSLPEGVQVGALNCLFGELVLPGRSIALSSESQSSSINSQLFAIPIQETSRPANNSGLFDLRNPRREWNFSESGTFSARVIPVEGAKLTGIAKATIVRKVIVKEMEIADSDQWTQGLVRLNKTKAEGWNPGVISFATEYHEPITWFDSSMRYPLRNFMSEYSSSSGGYGMLAPDNTIAWITHKSLPYASLLSGTTHGFQDVTRVRNLAVQNWSVSPSSALAPRMAPLARLRYLDEQCGAENWKLQFVRYEPIGTIDIPFSVAIKRPQSLPELQEEGDLEKLGELPPSFESRLAAIKLSESGPAEETRKALATLTELCVNRGDLGKFDPVIVPLLERMAASHPEILFEETKRAAEQLGDPRDNDSYIRDYGTTGFENSGSGSELWKQRVTVLNGYWARVISALNRTSSPDQKDLFLRYHSQQIDLMDAIYKNDWEKDALVLMQGIAAREPVSREWTLYLSRFPSPETSNALISQIRMGAYDFYRVLDVIEGGLVDGSEAANAAWDTTVARALKIGEVRDAFLLAVKFGVESAPRDLLRIIRSGMLEQGSDKLTNQRFLLSMLQALSVRSDCPLKLAEAVKWLDENAFTLSWNPVSRRYEKSGAAAGSPWMDPPESLGRWIDPMGVGTIQVEGDLIRMTSRALDTYCDYLVCQRPIPRLMKEVQGDFTAEVTVDFPFQPSPSWNGRDDGIAQNAGLIVEEGRYNFQRVFKGHVGRNNKAEIIEQIRRITGTWEPRLHNPSWDQAKPLRLKLCRHGDWFYTAWKQDDGEWNESEAQYNAAWGQTTRVGPFLCNKMILPLEVKFTGLSVKAGSEPPQKPVKAKFTTPGISPTTDGKQLANWGTVRNPLGNGEFVLDGGKLKIRSAPKLGNWCPHVRIGAPAVLQKVSGDFTYEVTVGPAPQGEWSSAVAVVCDPSKRFSYKVGNGTREKDKIWLNQLTWSEGTIIWPEAPLYRIDHRKPLRIRLERKGILLNVSTRQEGDADWKALTPRVLALWPDDLEVGVAGVNASGNESILEFENPVLTRAQGNSAR